MSPFRQNATMNALFSNNAIHESTVAGENRSAKRRIGRPTFLLLDEATVFASKLLTPLRLGTSSPTYRFFGTATPSLP